MMTMKLSNDYRTINAFYIAVIASLIISNVQADNFIKSTPTFFTPCTLRDPDNSKCVTDLFQSIFLKWKGDIPGSKAFSSLDPLKLKKIHVDQSESLVTIDLDVYDIIATGLSSSSIQNVGVQHGSNFQYVINIPKYHTKGDYTMKGRILVLDINGKGTSIIDISKLVVDVSFITEKVERDGEKFFQLIFLATKLVSVGDIRVRFDNLFGEGQNELSDSTNDLFNSNREQLLELFTPVVESTMNAYLLRRWNKIFKRIPAKYLFTDFRV
ncbi:protein takeout-like [Haematobia irritans]|uniref:protein takeout-like n=1 Tax=Haematobia irritans TaxID=7368 RepID=UPI003F506716